VTPGCCSSDFLAAAAVTCTVTSRLLQGGYELSEGERRVLLAQLDPDDHGGVKCMEWVAALIDWKDIQVVYGWQEHMQRLLT
jgi:hypothetical protein